jgi:hypothetical protein
MEQLHLPTPIPAMPCCKIDAAIPSTMPQPPYYFVPHQYFTSTFWRFLLDTKEDRAEHPPEPRFRQFSENLRNYAVSGTIVEVGLTVFHSAQSIADLIPATSLVAVGAIGVLCSEGQLFGPLALSFHSLVGFSLEDLRPHSAWDNWRQVLNTLSLMALPTILLWAMWEFAASYTWTIK